MLHFGRKPPFSFEKFLLMCERLIPEEDIRTLKGISISGEYTGASANRTLRNWRSFDTALRNELVKIRAARKKIDPLKYIREGGYSEAYIAHVAMNAQRNPSPIESEKTLDLERWRMLDEFLAGHYFDMDALIVYGLKLLILEKWADINSASRAATLDAVLQKA